MDGMARAAVRGAMTTIRMIALGAFVLFFLPLIVAAALFGFWRRLDVWAFYNGDENARDRDEWKQR